MKITDESLDTVAFERGSDGWPELMPVAYYEAARPHIKRVRAEIFRLAQQSPNLEIMHWYMALDECFENDEFHPDDFGKVQWRSFVLGDKGEPVIALLNMITPILRAANCVDSDGTPVPNTKSGAKPGHVDVTEGADA